ncbi:hybrid sensor histidine kinase/response regulator [Crocosphaera sp.]|uniref:hybrid sensor histidine kinase/response regulator n=1 Tax=Crocosphaera sp. TaxID=2729996 RepID=UPI00261B4A25|nr:hybrid sensor histidine kinase/response regulator [Crocosphaera sp.]MDJ0580780.1 hybrid sensor histidine kinase/response regulator [Crocosphaera sp.]
MDQEQQVRLNFLDEAHDCYDGIETALLELKSSDDITQQLDLALRSAHSVKGGAGMMGFNALSKVAHHLEDFFKILRVRHASTPIATKVETLLLQGVDCLRQVNELHRQGADIDNEWLEQNVNPIFEQLRNYLGDLQEEDENTLFSQNADNDEPVWLMFEEGVETVLDQFEQSYVFLSPTELKETLVLTAEQLLAFGQMAELDPFIQLCQSVQHQVTIVPNEQLSALTQQALSLWRRSHALVVRGSFEKLPSHLEGFVHEVTTQNSELRSYSCDGDTVENSSARVLHSEDSTEELLFLAENDTVENSSARVLHSEDSTEELLFLAEDDTVENSSARVLQSEENLSFTEDESLNLFTETELTDFSQLQNEIEQALDLSSETILNSSDLAELQNAFTLDTPSVETKQEETAKRKNDLEFSRQNIPNNLNPQTTGKTVRVPVEQLYQINSLFGKLVLERNSINLRLEQLTNFVALMRQRITQLETSNNHLKTWYDKASLEGMVLKTQELSDSYQLSVTGEQLNGASLLTVENDVRKFDRLEMDRYSDLHLISQEQIETIVQLEEVTSDMDLGLQKMTQVVQDFNQTTRSLQKNVTTTQMQPFADLVKPFPRLVRDLNLQWGKQVNLKIEGESTLIDRTMVETLNAPLMHLIRNAFAHAIEDPPTRIKAGKPPEATITLQAVNRGTETLITVKDDGKGIETHKICQQLRKMGVSDSEIAKMSAQEIIDYIFKPGLTTSEEVTELAGRGVGMDVVKTSLEEIRGDIRVNSEVGKGTTFILKVPFTLSILRVMLVESSGLIFAVPANSVREVLPLQVEGVNDLTEITWQEETIPLLHPEKSLQFNRPHKPFEMSGYPVINKPTALIVGNENSWGAIHIDHVWSEQEVTIRPIESPLPLPMGIISSMMLGDGRVVPLVDPVQLLEDCLDKGSQPITPSSQPATENTAKTILVVDDSINVRRYLTLTLEKVGYQVEQAKDGQDAVDKLVSGLVVDGVICDIEMPRLDGYGVLEELKTKPEFHSLPIAMLTSRSNEKHRKLAMNLGAAAYFSKPYNPQELLQTLHSIL